MLKALLDSALCSALSWLGHSTCENLLLQSKYNSEKMDWLKKEVVVVICCMN